MKEPHHQIPDIEFARQFKRRTLDPSLFTHEAHLRLAWIYINAFGIEKAIGMLCEQIQTFDQTFGDGSKYNKTVTIAAARAVHHFMRKGKATNFSVFIATYPKLKNQLKELLSTHYSFDIFQSEVARSAYIQPDLSPF